MSEHDTHGPRAPGGGPGAWQEGCTVFQRYDIIRRIGRGGMGVVYLAEDRRLRGLKVALKSVPELVVADEIALGELQREVLRGLTLTHENIVRIYGFEADAESAAVVMEYIDGQTLAAWRKAQPDQCLEPDILLSWLGQLCPALDYAHGQKMIAHRDLKPANLMLTSQGVLKIADFGIASALNDSMSRVSVRKDAAGTPAYMSPQQMMGAMPTPQDDLYALGATLFDLLTGTPPFVRGDIAAQVQNRHAPTISARRAERGIIGRATVPEVWEEAIAACLAKDPAARPQRAGELLAWLKEGRRPQAHPLPAAAEARESVILPTDADEDLPLSEQPTSAPEPTISAVRKTFRNLLKALPQGHWRAPFFGTLLLAGAGAVWSVSALVQRAPQTGLPPAAGPAKTPPPVVPATPPVAPATPPPATPASTPRPTTPPPATPPPATPPPVPVIPKVVATKEAPWVNSLGLRFVPVPGTEVFFSVHETRVKDFAAFVQAAGYDAKPNASTLAKDGWKARGENWENPGFVQKPDQPVVCVSWHDAQAFCDWLTKTEQTAGRLGKNRRYRLPSDHEWSCAVGLGGREDAKASPKAKDGKILDVYPWGGKWPPPGDAGNYAGEEFRTGREPRDFEVIRGRRDAWPRTAPVGSFAPNALGLCDLGGNVWEWCEDFFDPADRTTRVLRGASWAYNGSVASRSSFRSNMTPADRSSHRGFRCVLAGADDPPTGGKPVTEAAPQTRFAELVLQGKQLRERGDTGAALTKFREANAMDPRNPVAIAELAATYEKMRMLDRAGEQWKRLYDMGYEAGIYFSLAESKLKERQAPAIPEATTGGQTLALLPVTSEDLPNEGSVRKFLLHIPIKTLTKTRIEGRDLVIQVLFFDKVDGDKVVQTSAQVNTRWQTAPADWLDTETEVLAVTYDLPAPGSAAAPNHPRTYFGYVVRIYYKKKLQAAVAEPVQLEQTFSAPLVLPEETKP